MLPVGEGAVRGGGGGVAEEGEGGGGGGGGQSIGADDAGHQQQLGLDVVGQILEAQHLMAPLQAVVCMILEVRINP
jgi:hypothetical protein